MISNIAEAVDYSIREASELPELASEIKLVTPGYDTSTIASLRREDLDLPISYLNTLKQVQVLGVSIGRLLLHPEATNAQSVLECLLYANNDSSNPFLSLYESLDLIQIAEYESLLICVRKSASKRQQGVYLFDPFTNKSFSLDKLAESFEDLIVLSSNLHDVSLNYDESPDFATNEMVKRLDRLGVPSDVKQTWVRLLLENI